MAGIKCEKCNKITYASVLPIDEQRPGGYIRLLVCTDCYREHQRYLESLRENFRRQFGDR